MGENADSIRGYALIAIFIYVCIVFPVISHFYRKSRKGMPFQGKEEVKYILIFGLIPFTILITTVLILIGGLSPFLIIMIVTFSLVFACGFGFLLYTFITKTTNKEMKF